MTGDSANGMSTIAFSSDRPWKRCRTSTHATMTPNSVVMTTAITVMMAVSWKAWSTSGCVSVWVTLDQPAFTTVQRMAIMGNSSSNPTQTAAAAMIRRRPRRPSEGRAAAGLLTRPPRAASAASP